MKHRITINIVLIAYQVLIRYYETKEGVFGCSGGLATFVEDAHSWRT